MPRILFITLCLLALLSWGCKDGNEPALYTVTVSGDGNGTVSSDVRIAEAGTTVKLTATANDGFVFKRWVVSSGEALIEDPAANPVTFTMPAGPVAIVGEFEEPAPVYTVSITTDGNGNAVADPERVHEGETVTITATPGEGYRFREWAVESGDIALTDLTLNPATFAMAPGNVSIKATFEPDIPDDILKVIPDPVFREFCRRFDTDGDGKLSPEEAAVVDFMDLFFPMGEKIGSLEGIEYFTGLTFLDCSNHEITTLDLSRNTRLTELYCNSGQLTSLNITQCPDLLYLYCSENQLTELDLTNNPLVEELSCQRNRLTALDLKNKPRLTEVDCSSNLIEELGLSDCFALGKLNCEHNLLSSLHVASRALWSLSCNDNSLASLDVAGNTALILLSCANNRITSLNLTANRNLSSLYCSGNRLSVLDASGMDFSSVEGSYQLICGNQTSDGTTTATLSLTLRSDQMPYWESSLANNDLNKNVVLLQ